MNSSSASICSILDLPDEILIKIILHFDARERLALAKTCKKFNNLVFGDQELLRDLDFSKEWQLTSKTDIQEYFMKESTYKHTHKVNIRNIECTTPGRMLNNSIGKAINLVDLNIHGTTFSGVDDLHRFLEPLVNLKRLSLNWPYPMRESDADCCKNLQKLLSRLTYLEVEIFMDSGLFLRILQLCQELEELRLVTNQYSGYDLEEFLYNPESDKLRNLKIFQFHGPGSARSLKKSLMDMVPDSREWTDFHLAKPWQEGYLERNVVVCEELSQVKCNPVSGSLAYASGCYNVCMGWLMLCERLLSEVTRSTHEDAPEEFCCLRDHTEMGLQPCLLKIDEAKELLKDPAYQISYLNISHPIEPDCDIHLLASAFPNLTELIISQICTTRTPKTTKHCERRLRKKGSTALVEHDDPKNLDSSFQMLVENTPDLESLTIFMTPDNEIELFDLDALYQISGWKNLTAIRLREIPITDGNFLIDIGKECEKLEELLLYLLGPEKPCYYTSELSQMLMHCKNLRKFSICQLNIENIPELFTSLSNNSKLRTVRLITETELYNSTELVSSVEQLLRRCPELTKFVLMIQSALNGVDEGLTSALEKIIGELNRPNFQFYGPVPTGSSSVYQDTFASFLLSPSDDQNYIPGDNGFPKTRRLSLEM